MIYAEHEQHDVSPRKMGILFVDAYDSFSNNVIGLLENVLDAKVTTIKIDHQFQKGSLESYVGQFDAVIIGPGPGHPTNPDDIGFVPELWRLDEQHLVPILGICLGHQSLASNFGATVKRLPEPRHGIVTDITHCQSDIFEGITVAQATQYHSLHVDLGHSPSLELDDPQLWRPSEQCPSLRPLAWDVSVNGTLISMAIRHTRLPFWSLQFHPESCYTTPKLRKVIKQWGVEVAKWNASNERARKRDMKQINWTGALSQTASIQQEIPTQLRPVGNKYSCSKPIVKCIQFLQTNGCRLFEGCQQRGWQPLFLESQLRHRKGRFSILGMGMSNSGSIRLQYNVHERVQTLVKDGIASFKKYKLDQVWEFLQATLDDQKVPQDSCFAANVPFWGGWIGYISYEAGLQTIDISPNVPEPRRRGPDINFVWINRSIVVDHEKGEAWVQSLLPYDEQWLDEAEEIVKETRSSACGQPSDSDVRIQGRISEVRVYRPEEHKYRDQVLECQEFLRSGDSYELCLTDESKLLLPRDVTSWQLYQRLRVSNPAPFGAFLQLEGANIVGSSPERFLSWNRTGRCRMEPIKGTVRKSPEMTLEKATDILSSSKEIAENLMIVDLIRHDLAGACGSRNVSIERLMQVEEYENVYQLVSVIEAQVPRLSTAVSEPENAAARNGLDVLKASLPPGSMTGAPKKRSCELLGSIENRERGIYSGIVGYLDVGGGGDFSVVIRTLFQDGEDWVGAAEAANALPGPERQVWRAGAGGAVTIQSTDKGEFDEMETKLESVLSMF